MIRFVEYTICCATYDASTWLKQFRPVILYILRPGNDHEGFPVVGCGVQARQTIANLSETFLVNQIRARGSAPRSVSSDVDWQICSKARSRRDNSLDQWKVSGRRRLSRYDHVCVDKMTLDQKDPQVMFWFLDTYIYIYMYIYIYTYTYVCRDIYIYI